jgi:uncharacterized protein with PQ loop repeat
MELRAFAEGLGYLGSVLGVAMVVPQIVRTYRNRALPGVSAISWALTAISCFTWLLYGIRAAEPPQIPGNVLLVSGAVVVVLAVPSARSVRFRAAGLLLAGSVVTAVAFSVPSGVIGSIGFAIGLVSGFPQLVVSLARRSGECAVSLLTWGLRVACQASWLTYAILIGDTVVTVSAAFLGTSAALVLGAELARRPRAATLPAPATALAPTP